MKEHEVFLPEYCNILNFEKLLLENSQKSRNCDHIKFYFSGLHWIGVLQMSQIYGWVTELCDLGKQVSIYLPDLERNITYNQINYPGLWFLSRTKFFVELEKAGANISQLHLSENSSGLAAFKGFLTFEELLSYQKTLGDPESCYKLLGGGDDIDLIRDGDLREIILHELGENAFIHGEGKRVRYGVCEFGMSAERKTHKILADFGGKSYVETVVSDSGKGLLKTLESLVPKDYKPDVELTMRSLREDVKTVIYAFEFNTTCDEESRKARFAQIIDEGKDVIEGVPSGLFYIAALSKLYGGQVLVRTGKSLVSLDFSVSTLPKISSFNIPNKSQLASISGTHVLIRVPRQHLTISHNKIIKPIYSRRASLPNKPRIKYIPIYLADIKKSCKSKEEFVYLAEQKICKTLSEASEKNVPLVTVLGNALDADTREFSLLLIILSVIPRCNRALIFLGLRDGLVETALNQWDHIQKIKGQRSRLLDRVHGYRSLILMSNDISKTIEFGNNRHPDSTVIAEKSKSEHYLEYTNSELAEIYLDALHDQLKNLIEIPPVKHPERYYLIQGKYYTKTFYEVGKLTSDGFGREVSANYFKLIFRKYNIGAVFTISEPLFSFSKFMQPSFPDIVWIKRNPESEITSFQEALIEKKKGRKLLILTDVVCTADEIQKFLSIPANLDEVIIACFVDGREEGLNYIAVNREEKAYSIPVIAIQRTKIKPIDDLPPTVNYSEVLIIDRRTHSPTSYDHIEIPELKTNELVEIAIENNALFHGHFNFQGKHYSDFLFFSRLFKGINKNLEDWWDNTFNMLNKGKINKKDMSVYYLDERRGWEKLVVDYMSTKSVAKCEALTREQLNAPPPESLELKCIWFILPAIANGDITRLCLEYGSRFKPERIIVSIIVARMDSTRLSFYQNIKGYRDCKNVSIQTLTVLPIKAYPSVSSCTLCDVEKTIDKMRHRAEGYEYLSAIINNRRDFFNVKEITLNDIESDLIQVATIKDKKRIQMRALYEEAIRNFECRKDLGEKLMNQQDVDNFIEMIGDEFLYSQFSKELVEQTTYTRYENIESTIAKYLETCSQEKLSLRMLLGIHQLFPEMLARNIKSLFSKSLKILSKVLCEDIIFIALMYPEKYGIELAGWTEEVAIDKEWIINLIRDMRTYPHWHNVESSYAVKIFSELLWLLRRSTTWGSNMEHLRSVIRAVSCTHEDIMRAYQALEHNGVKVVLHHLDQLKNMEARSPGGLWSAIKTVGNDLEKTIKSIVESNEKIGEIINNEKKYDLGDLSGAVNELDNYGKSLTIQLKKLFTNPIDAKMRIDELASVKWPDSIIDIRFTIDPEQPGILVSLEDLLQSLIHIIDNAHDCVEDYKKIKGKFPPDPWIEFCFKGYTQSKFASLLLVRDNLPWSRRLAPEGGMKQVIQYCQKYAAVYDFNLRSPDQHARMNIIYRIDDKGGRHVYR